jgi:arylsulfatase A-like enzyme
VHALRNIHGVLISDGLLVDTQPLSPHPPVAADGADLGTLDMREWLDTIRAVDDRVAEVVDACLYEEQHEERLVVTDTFDNGPNASRPSAAGAERAYQHHSSRDSRRRKSL